MCLSFQIKVVIIWSMVACDLDISVLIISCLILVGYTLCMFPASITNDSGEILQLEVAEAGVRQHFLYG